jgi:crotonobetainyl-CoA:carnitine CoA-transferase CaiB-like acyl-CoA transferase
VEASERVSGPLEGVRLIDLSPDRVGAQVGQTLADYGADAVWVEPPGGSRLRQQRAFPFYGRAKRSVVVDLGTSEGVERVRSLAEGADVLIETFRPGVPDGLGLGYEAFLAASTGLESRARRRPDARAAGADHQGRVPGASPRAPGARRRRRAS